MAEVCKRANAATNRLHDQCSTATKDNAELSERLRQAEEKVKQAEAHMQAQSDQQLRDQPCKTEKKVEETNNREKDGRPH